MIVRRARTCLTCLTVPFLLIAGCREPSEDGVPTALSAPTPSFRIEIVDLRPRVAVDQPAEGLVGRPRFVRLDPAGDLFVADVASLRIKVYGGDGVLRRAVGGRGREMGRFLTINSFHIDGAGRLIVADGRALRTTVFSSSGRVLYSRPLDPLQMLWPRQLLELGDGRLVFLCHMPAHTQSGDRRPDADYLFHPYDAGLERKLTPFGPVADVGTPENEIASIVGQLTPGSFCILRSGAVLFAPSIYGGRLIRYRETEAGWREDTRLAGYVPDDEPLIELDEPARADGTPGAIQIFGGGKKSVAVVRHQSRGLFELADGRIVHFSSFEIDGRRVFGVELWSADGAFLGYRPIEPIQDWRSDHLYVDWKGGDDTFLVREMGSEPKIYGLRLAFIAEERNPSGNPLPGATPSGAS